VYNTCVAEFQKIVSLAKLMVENPEYLTDDLFCFDQGFVFELVLVALTCWDLTLWSRAIESLETKDWRGAFGGADEWRMEPD
jgi:hypothetical protein